MYYDELSYYRGRLPFTLAEVRCVGWIDPSHEYLTGDCPEDVVPKLMKLLVTRTSSFDTHVNITRGIDPCGFCGHRIEIVGEDGKRAMLGMSEVWLPYCHGWLAAPSLVLHYIDAHRYLPPFEFIDAVRTAGILQSYIGQAVLDELIQRYSGDRVWW